MCACVLWRGMVWCVCVHAYVCVVCMCVHGVCACMHARVRTLTCYSQCDKTSDGSGHLEVQRTGFSLTETTDTQTASVKNRKQGGKSKHQNQNTSKTMCLDNIWASHVLSGNIAPLPTSAPSPSRCQRDEHVKLMCVFHTHKIIIIGGIYIVLSVTQSALQLKYTQKLY